MVQGSCRQSVGTVYERSSRVQKRNRDAELRRVPSHLQRSRRGSAASRPLCRGVGRVDARVSLRSPIIRRALGSPVSVAVRGSEPQSYARSRTLVRTETAVLFPPRSRTRAPDRVVRRITGLDSKPFLPSTARNPVTRFSHAYSTKYDRVTGYRPSRKFVHLGAFPTARRVLEMRRLRPTFSAVWERKTVSATSSSRFTNNDLDLSGSMLRLLAFNFNRTGLETARRALRGAPFVPLPGTESGRRRPCEYPVSVRVLRLSFRRALARPSSRLSRRGRGLRRTERRLFTRSRKALENVDGNSVPRVPIGLLDRYEFGYKKSSIYTKGRERRALWSSFFPLPFAEDKICARPNECAGRFGTARVQQNLPVAKRSVRSKSFTVSGAALYSGHYRGPKTNRSSTPGPLPDRGSP